MDTYVKGVSDILRNIDGKTDFDSQTLASVLRAWKNTTWIEVDREDMITAVTQASPNPILAAIYAADNPRLQKPGPTLQTIFGEKFTTIEIRPSNITAPWGGVFLLHELAMTNGSANLSLEIKQLKASLVTYSAMNRIVGPDLRVQLDETLSKLKVKHPTHLNRLWKMNDSTLTTELATLDERITKIAPAGSDDADLRIKLEFSYLLIRYYEKSGWLNLSSHSKITQELGQSILKLNL